MKKGSMGLLFSVVFMDMVGFGFIIPILPDYVANLGASTQMFGFILGIYALGQFIAAPLVGRLSDRFGRKPLLLFSIGGTFASLLLLGFARTIPLIFISRALDGLTGGNITVAQSYISDITSEEDRSKGLGIIGAAFGLGFIFGPLFGGLLVNINVYAPAFVAAGLAALNLILITIILPESLPPEERGTINRDVQRPSIANLVTGPGLASLLGMMFFYSLAFSMFQTMFSPHAMEVFGLSAQSRSYILAYVGVIIAVAQGFLISRLIKKFSERMLLLVSNFLLALSLAVWGLNANFVVLLLIMIPLAIAGGLQGVLLRSLVTKEAGKGQLGSALGLTASLDSFNRILAPVLGGILIAQAGPTGPGLAGTGFLVVGAVTYVLLQKKQSNSSLNEPVNDEGCEYSDEPC